MRRWSQKQKGSDHSKKVSARPVSEKNGREEPSHPGELPHSHQQTSITSVTSDYSGSTSSLPLQQITTPRDKRAGQPASIDQRTAGNTHLESTLNMTPIVAQLMDQIESKFDDVASRLDNQFEKRLSLLEGQIKDCLQKEMKVMFIRMRSISLRDSRRHSDYAGRAGRRPRLQSSQIRRAHSWHNETVMPTIREEITFGWSFQGGSESSLQSETDLPLPSELSLSEPHREIILWLSENIVEWKFFARYLTVEEKEIERIEKEHQNDVREQCYQMLRQWERCQAQTYTYYSLGTALRRDFKNRHLYGKFVKEVMKNEPVVEDEKVNSDE